MMPAYYLMATSAVGAVAIYFLKESARRPLPGSMPSVDTQAEARELVAGQDDNPLIDLDELPFETQDVTTASAAADSAAADKVPAGAAN
jgi:MHS family proline/betaine transporter-like MFS transporter